MKGPTDLPKMQIFFRRSYVLPVISFFLYLAGSAPFLGQWDSYDYLKQIVSHQLSALGFGRPVFLGYNIVLWESAKSLFHLEPQKVEAVVMMGTVLLGVLGVWLFQRLAAQFLSPSGSRMAALSLALSPVYAIYSGFIMTEVPMLVALIGAALLLWKPAERHRILQDALAGVFFGLAIGIREQALTMVPAFLWMLCSRDLQSKHRVRSVLWFSATTGLAVAAPIAGFYFWDPSGFIEHMRVWLRAIPMGHIQFWNNVQASVLYSLLVCPATWMAAMAAGILASRQRQRAETETPISSRFPILYPIIGIFCCVVLPMVVLWRDADVQIHPRYALIVLPGALITCVYLYTHCFRSRRAPVIWALVHTIIFGLAMVVFFPFRQTLTDKMTYARAVRDAVPGEALIISGSYSPMVDYFRGIGVRPQWRILWSGWEFQAEAADKLIRESWDGGVPVYLSEEPLGWRYFESEYLHYYYLFKDCRREAVAPKLVRIYPH
jgi:hypothetical protein